MKDETYLFHSDCREKKNVARSAKHVRTHRGKGGRVKFPSDHLSKKELNAMNGEVKSYRLNDPMSWDEFRSMPDDLKIAYIKALREKYNVPDSHIARMMGANTCSFSNEMGRLGLRVGVGARNNCTAWDKDGFYAWCTGTTNTETVVEPAVEPVAEEIPAPVIVEDEIKCSHNWEAECVDLRMKCREMQDYIHHLVDENSKLGIQYEQLLKEKSDLDRKVGFLEGQIEAYQYCMNCRR